MKEDIILLSHGNGGQATKKLIDNFILKHLGNKILNNLFDAALFNINGKLAFTTDSFVISPLFFEGGDIGHLAVYGTCNDLAVMGAKPMYLSLGFIIEEGLPLKEFEKILVSISQAAEKAEVIIVTGDTKVVEKGKGDGIFINTSGIGIVESQRDWTKRKIKKGDKVIISGTIGDHGISVMLKRLGVKTTSLVKSDLAPVNSLTLPLLDRFNGIKFMRDPTRGGVATVLNEVSKNFHVEIEVEEATLPINTWAKEASELLGIDPLYMANEGKVLIIADNKQADNIVTFLHAHEKGQDASIIGKIKDVGENVYLKTTIGTHRIVDTLKKDILPRIC